MSESDAASTQADLKALEALNADVAALDRVEKLLDRYNVFEAIGFGDQEVMHSHFLAFLLDPKQKHRLGNLFLRSFLRRVSQTAKEDSRPSPCDHIGDGNLRQTTVQTEVYTEDGRIDVLLLDVANRWAIIIENKIWTFEHSCQLQRYYRFVERIYPGCEVFGVYLTPLGDPPTHEKYLPLGYGAVCEVIDSILEASNLSPNSDVRMSMEHYTDMVRRHIVGDSEITRLCQEIYRKHKRALDLIYEQRPDPQRSIRELLVRLIRNTEGLSYKGSMAGGRFVSFRPEGWESPHGSLNFVFHNSPEELSLLIEVGWADEELRRKLFEMAGQDASLFNHLLEHPAKGTNPKLYRRPFLAPDSYKEGSDGDRAEEVRRQWGEFLDQDLPRLEEAVRKETWIWE
jgi:hypothetical protein